MRSEPPSSGPFASLDDHVARLDGLSTPPYRCQKQFGLYQGGHAKWQVADRFESFVIMDALEIARRFVGSPLGLYFSSMALLFADTEERLSGSCATHVTMTNNTVHQERMRNQILDFLDGDNVEIRIDVKTRSDAYVSSPDHKVIYVRLELVQAAGLARKIKNIDRDSYWRHLFHLAVVLTHEVQHLLRIRIAGISWHTPPKLIGCGQPGLLLEFEGVQYQSGEGGWWFEQRFFGGHVKALICTDGGLLVYKARQIIVQKFDPQEWHVVLPNVIFDLCKGTPDWEIHLPLAPHRSQNVISGFNTERKLRDVSAGYTQLPASTQAGFHPGVSSERCGGRRR